MVFTWSYGVAASLLAAADIVAAQTIPAGDRIESHMLEIAGEEVLSGHEALMEREAKRTIYVNQPVTLENTRAARLVERNQIVALSFQSGALEITLTGRALGAAARGEQVQVMNLDTRKMLTGVVQEGGWVLLQ